MLYGLVVSILPGAITDEPFHQLRLMGYAVFLLVLTVPALEWLLAPTETKQRAGHGTEESHDGEIRSCHGYLLRPSVAPNPARLSWNLAGSDRCASCRFPNWFPSKRTRALNEFDVLYKPLYDIAVAQPERPIYLENGQWGPAYMDAYWYATVEGRPYLSLFAFPMGEASIRARLSSARTQTARTASLSRKAGLSALQSQVVEKPRVDRHNHCSGSIDSLTM